MHKKDSCHFCNWRDKFTRTHFDDKRLKDEQRNPLCNAWIDYEEDKNGVLLWYAVLCGEQYTKGHTLVIIGPHIDNVIDPYLDDELLFKLTVGLRCVARRLKEVFGGESVHVLSLSEGTKHLHFHLIPRYRYEMEELIFYIYNYWDRDKDIAENNEGKLWADIGYTEYAKDVMNKRDRHGMWYAAYHEMKFANTKFWELSVQDRVIELEKMAKDIRGSKPPPSFLQSEQQSEQRKSC